MGRCVWKVDFPARLAVEWRILMKTFRPAVVILLSVFFSEMLIQLFWSCPGFSSFYGHWQGEDGRGEFRSSLLQHELQSFDNASASRAAPARACWRPGTRKTRPATFILLGTVVPPFSRANLFTSFTCGSRGALRQVFAVQSSFLFSFSILVFNGEPFLSSLG